MRVATARLARFHADLPCMALIAWLTSGDCATESPGNQYYAGTSDGENSRCFMSNLKSNDFPTINIGTGPSCYATSCTTAGVLQIIVKRNGGATVGTFDCPQEGGALTVRGYSGTIDCPPAADICDYDAMVATATQAMVDPAALRFRSNLPRSGSTAGGTAVRLFGRGFANPANDLTVTFGTTPAASVTVVDDTEVSAVSPAGEQPAVHATAAKP